MSQIDKQSGEAVLQELNAAYIAGKRHYDLLRQDLYQVQENRVIADQYWTHLIQLHARDAQHLESIVQQRHGALVQSLTALLQAALNQEEFRAARERLRLSINASVVFCQQYRWDRWTQLLMLNTLAAASLLKRLDAQVEMPLSVVSSKSPRLWNELTEIVMAAFSRVKTIGYQKDRQSTGVDHLPWENVFAKVQVGTSGILTPDSGITLEPIDFAAPLPCQKQLVDHMLALKATNIPGRPAIPISADDDAHLLSVLRNGEIKKVQRMAQERQHQVLICLSDHLARASALIEAARAWMQLIEALDLALSDPLLSQPSAWKHRGDKEQPSPAFTEKHYLAMIWNIVVADHLAALAKSKLLFVRHELIEDLNKLSHGNLLLESAFAAEFAASGEKSTSPGQDFGNLFCRTTKG